MGYGEQCILLRDGDPSRLNTMALHAKACRAIVFFREDGRESWAVAFLISRGWRLALTERA
jgi:hypothetical protein